MRGSRMTRALLASAVVMDAAGWMCAAQGAYGLARCCFAAALPFIAAWALAQPAALVVHVPRGGLCNFHHGLQSRKSQTRGLSRRGYARGISATRGREKGV